MNRIALIVLAVAALTGATATTAGAMHINVGAPRMSGAIAGGSHTFTPRPFSRMPDVSIPLGGVHSPIKHAQKPASAAFCEALYQCCVRSGGHAASCCNGYNNDKFCPY